MSNVSLILEGLSNLRKKSSVIEGDNLGNLNKNLKKLLGDKETEEFTDIRKIEIPKVVLEEEDRWVTIKGTHTLIDGDGNIKNEKLRKSIENSKERSREKSGWGNKDFEEDFEELKNSFSDAYKLKGQKRKDAINKKLEHVAEVINKALDHTVKNSMKGKNSFANDLLQDSNEANECRNALLGMFSDKDVMDTTLKGIEAMGVKLSKDEKRNIEKLKKLASNAKKSESLLLDENRKLVKLSKDCDDPKKPYNRVKMNNDQVKQSLEEDIEGVLRSSYNVLYNVEQYGKKVSDFVNFFGSDEMKSFRDKLENM